MINILIRTSKRPKSFKRLYESIKKQSSINYKLHISYDNEDDLDYLSNYDDILLYKMNINEILSKYTFKERPNTAYTEFPYNLYLNELNNNIDNGWIIYIDDDNYIDDGNFLKKINYIIESNDENTLIFWKYKVGNLIVPSYPISRDNPPIINNIDTSCICFNYKWKEYILWDKWKGSDFRIINKLFNIIPKIQYIDEIFIKAEQENLGKSEI